MPVLKNARHEKFAQGLAGGKTADEAYELAGFKPNRGNASRLKSNENILKRIEEIKAAVTERAIEKLAVTKERIVEELAKIGFSNMLDYMRAGPDGDPYLDFSGLTRDQAAALSEVTVEDFKDGRGEDARDVRRVKFKLHDKKGALVDLAKLLGYVVDKHEVTGKNGGAVQIKHSGALADMTAEERAFLRQMVERRATGNNSDDE
ncbi:terminase small subunit [Rhizobium lusitanum]|uniref:Phage terminase small subunit n=1 Tax=Rhizobium lusitanum TaxID=293958 RepID=A0A1C3VRQ9_9HYPH|nr:terminase small subunit [Rhizobium lusitanum]SCB30388.1 phage terminase small subunit [Rhizobium lusitanum]